MTELIMMDETKRLLLTTRLLADELSRREYNFQFYDRSCGRGLVGCRFLVPGGDAPDAEHVCIVTMPVYDALPMEGGAVITIGSASEKLLSGHYDVVELDEKTEPFALMNMLSEVFDRYREWDAAARRAAEGGDIQELALLGRHLFENPIFIHDAQYNYLVNQLWSGSGCDSIKNQRLGIDAIPSAKLREMFASSAYMETLDTRGARLYHDFPRVSNRIIYVNLWENDRWVGRVCIDEIFSSIQPGQFYLAEYFAELVRRVMTGHKLALSNVFSAVKESLRAVLRGDPVDGEQFQKNLMQIGMNREDDYQLLWITPADGESGLLRQPNVCYELELKLPNSCALLLQDGVLLLVNRSISRLDEGEVCTAVSGVLKSVECRIGVSDRFAGLQSLTDYYRQAAYAVSSAGEGDGGTVSFYRDCALNCLVSEGSRALPLCCRIAPEIWMLGRYDRENGTDLLQTLKLYLRSDANMARAAEQLFIHRSTMTYRMEKIVSLTGLDLHDCSMKLLLLLGFYIIDSEKISL